jgi:hypothetical protein
MVSRGRLSKTYLELCAEHPCEMFFIFVLYDSIFLWSVYSEYKTQTLGNFQIDIVILLLICKYSILQIYGTCFAILYTVLSVVYPRYHTCVIFLQDIQDSN